MLENLPTWLGLGMRLELGFGFGFGLVAHQRVAARKQHHVKRRAPRLLGVRGRGRVRGRLRVRVSGEGEGER